ncbi:magnesium chelatase [Reichenbachiella sp. 5M10]|uniref:AAA family ATPase n=1 Tax=Reichenbachiella sp. 5M10 TaxID=1889772 RepID=UPI000C147F4F|nr:MoxR family ATPase [Reichenbachiella sp. 5M10]PIB36935.1 magnesium chelatase [Reichenbachiella sp. 5M10]
MSEENRSQITAISAKVAEVKSEIKKVIVGQEEMLDQLIIGLISGGHVLIEGVPGIAKTFTAKTLAKLISAQFGRIQFTSDLMPSDVLGTSIFNLKTNEFEFKKGPIFTEILLIDEINRAPAKTQAALFEIMEESQVTVDGHCYPMSDLFFALATQNPVEQEGTYRLPEAQLDRFLFKVVTGYPTLEEEVKIMELHNEGKMKAEITAVLTTAELMTLRTEAKKVVIDAKLLDFIARIMDKTRTSPDIYLGASPRAAIGIMHAAKIKAILEDRDFVIPEDVLYVAYPVLRHRLILSPEKEMEGLTTDDIIKLIIDQVEIPR